MLSTALALGFGLSSCSDDDPPAKPKLSFPETARTVTEDAGIIEVELRLDKAHSKDLLIEYSLSGTASDQHNVGTANADYRVIGERGVVEIDAGQTSGSIRIEIYNDALFEPDETIEIEITDTNTDEIERTADDAMVITITSDDAQVVASFVNTTMTVTERDGLAVDNGDLVLSLIKIPVQLDKAASSDLVVQYDIKLDLTDPERNDAIDSVWASQNGIPTRYYDYYVHGTKGELTIPGGSTTADIEIQVLTDFLFEDDEFIEITLKESGSVQIGTNNKMTITLGEQDGKVILLEWHPDHTDVDMDMFLWVGADTTSLNAFLPLGITPSVTNKYEIIFLPTVFAEGGFGLSYVYYEGTANPMEFRVSFAGFADGDLESVDDWVSFEASYTPANINPWDTEAGTYPPAIVQRFVVENGVYSYGNIQVPVSGSRVHPTDVVKPQRMKSPVARRSVF